LILIVLGYWLGVVTIWLEEGGSPNAENERS
jgi:hypothetical protein